MKTIKKPKKKKQFKKKLKWGDDDGLRSGLDRLSSLISSKGRANEKKKN